MTFHKSSLVLGIDTSGEYCSVGIAKDGNALGEISLHAPQAHSSQLIPSIDKILKDNHLKIQDVNGIAVSLGPGCFTGLRVGVATAKALAQALEVPIVGVPTLDMIALNVTKIDCHAPLLSCESPHKGDESKKGELAMTNVCVVMDARKEQIYTAKYSVKCPPPLLSCDSKTGGRAGKESKLKKITKDRVTTIDDLLSTFNFSAPFGARPRPNVHRGGQLSTVFIGNAIAIYGDKIKERLGEPAIFAPQELWYPRASNIALEGFKKLQKNKKGDNLFKLKPTYIREPDIRKPKNSH